MTWEIAPDEPPDDEGDLDVVVLGRYHRTLPPQRDDSAYGAWLTNQRAWWNHGRRVLEQRLLALLDDGTGRTRPELTRLGWELTATPVPFRGLV